MSEIEEGKVGELIVKIDRLICVGFGDCIELDGTPFEFDAEGIATLRPDAGSAEESVLVEACRSCPVDALTILTPAGAQIVP